jgi:hypothetical protein
MTPQTSQLQMRLSILVSFYIFMNFVYLLLFFSFYFVHFYVIFDLYQDFENWDLTKEAFKDLIWREILAFHPEATAAQQQQQQQQQQQRP